MIFLIVWKEKKNWIRKETYHTSNETFHQRFNFSSWKKSRKQTSICFRNKTTFTFSKKRKEKRNMFLSWFPIFFNPLDIIWVFNNLPSLNSIILLLMFIFYLFKVLLPAPFFLYFFFLADAWLHPITILVSWIFNSHTYFKDTQPWLYTLMMLHVL